METPDGSPNPIRDRLPVSIDFYNNEINNMEDNCIESDGGAYNIRILRNRCFNHGHRALSVQPMFGGPVYFIRNIVYHAPEGGAVKLTATSSGMVFYHNTLIAPVKPMLGAVSNVHFRNNLILGKSETTETFAIETYTNYSSSDYNGFRPMKARSFPSNGCRRRSGCFRDIRAPPGLSPQDRIKAEVGSKEDRKFKTLQEFSEATGQDRHSVIVDYDVFQKVTAPDENDPRILYQALGFRFPTSPWIGSGGCGSAAAECERWVHWESAGSGRVRSGTTDPALRAAGLGVGGEAAGGCWLVAGGWTRVARPGESVTASKSCPDRCPPPVFRLGGTRSCCWMSRFECRRLDRRWSLRISLPAGRCG